MRKVIFFSVLILILFGSVYTWWFYYNTYSDGYREGVLQKFSRKGNIFKTHEGEMILLGFRQRNGALNADYFYFSVDDHAIADSLEKSLGKVVKIHYVQYRKSLPWRGENYGDRNPERGQYVADGISSVQENR